MTLQRLLWVDSSLGVTLSYPTPEPAKLAAFARFEESGCTCAFEFIRVVFFAPAILCLISSLQLNRDSLPFHIFWNLPLNLYKYQDLQVDNFKYHRFSMPNVSLLIARKITLQR